VHAGDADVVVNEFLPQHLGEAAYRELAGRVGGLAGRRDDAEDAGHVDQVRARLGLQRRQQHVRQGDLGPEVDVDDPVVVVEADLVEAAAEGDPGVVDEQPDPRVGGEDGLGGAGRGVPIGQVDHVRLDGAAAGAQVVGDALEPRLVAVQQHEVAAAGGQAVRDGLADAAGRSGHHRGATGEHERAHQASTRSDVASVVSPVAARARLNRIPASASLPYRISSTSRA
jgi:hypothetical protein